MPSALEIRGPAVALLDDPLTLRARYAGDGDALRWRARFKDDDGRVWRANALRSEDLPAHFAAKERVELPALQSLRPVAIEVRLEAPDGRGAARTITRRLTGDGVRLRRWRDGGLAATLHLPAEEAPAATVLAAADDVSALAAPLLASRGVLVLTVKSGIEEARERLQAVPRASGEPRELGELPRPPGLPGGDGERWDALLAELGARAR